MGSNPVEDVEDPVDVQKFAQRILRGGSYGGRPPFVRSANRYQAPPETERTIMASASAARCHRDLSSLVSWIVCHWLCQ